VSGLRRRATIALTVVVVVLGVTAAAALGVRTLWRTATSTAPSESCATGAYSVDTDQAAVASTMVGVVIGRGLPERAAVLVLAAGLQESKLRNLASGDGDRDSVGVLQQRPSQGWGTIAQLSDVRYATGKFLDALVKLPNWQTDQLAVAVQAVQISADGSAYAGHEGQAQALADALTGAHPAGMSCSFAAPSLVATTAQVATAVSTDLPVNPPTTSGLTVSVPGASWATAAWFIANADRLGIDSVAYSQRAWSRTKGWRTDDDAGATDVVATMHK
jgi:hypothetical protein